MSKIMNEYLIKKNTYLQPTYYDDIHYINKALYTGCLSDIEKIFRVLNYSDEDKKIHNIMKTEILKTHNKINELIESFNKDTDYKYKEMFENRSDYCDDSNCIKCRYNSYRYPFISCLNDKKYKKLEMDKVITLYSKLIENINNEFIKFLKLEIV